MELKKTPSSYDPARELFEYADQRDDYARVFSITLDTMIESYTKVLINESITPEDKANLYQMLLASVKSFVESSSISLKDNYTDYFRLTMNADLLWQKIFVPLMMRAPQIDSSEIEKTINGIQGTFVDGFAELLPIANRLDSPNDKGRIRGVIQESTVGALLNHEQTADLVALPASTYEDVCLGIDMFAFIIVGNDSCKIPISIKSSWREGEIDKKRNRKRSEDYVVLTADDFDNKDLRVSKALARIHKGTYSDSDEYLVRDAVIALRRAFDTQIHLDEPCAELYRTKKMTLRAPISSIISIA